jgi:hypothetical protein
MGFTISLMISFANNAIIAYKDSAYHWIWSHISRSELCQLKAPMHISVVSRQSLMVNGQW